MNALCAVELDVIQGEAKSSVRRVAKYFRLSVQDREDLAQELLLDLLRRLRFFDASRGTLGAFSGIVTRRHSSRIARRLRRDTSTVNFVSFDAAPDLIVHVESKEASVRSTCLAISQALRS